jgi:hypothetical protein
LPQASPECLHYDSQVHPGSFFDDKSARFLTQPSTARNHCRVWGSFENDETLGTRGSEEGLILQDQEHPLGARITLESEIRFGAENPAPIPYAITCSIYGLFFHTRFCAREADARNAFAEMELELARILALAAFETASDEETRQMVFDAVSAFIERYPT